MAGGKSRPKKDKSIKVTSGQQVGVGKILIRGRTTYRPGINVGGLSTLYALSAGSIYFSKKKTPGGKIRTFVHILPPPEKPQPQK